MHNTVPEQTLQEMMTYYQERAREYIAPVRAAKWKSFQLALLLLKFLYSLPVKRLQAFAEANRVGFFWTQGAINVR